MHIAKPFGRMATAGAACAAVFIGAVTPTLHAQSTGSSPSWASPIDDVTGRQTIAVPVQPAAPSVAMSRTTVMNARQALVGMPPLPRSASVTPAQTVPLGQEAATTRPQSERPIGEQWSSGRDLTLHAVVYSWAHRAGWRVLWRASSDRRIEAPLTFEGSFQAALRGVFGLYAKTSNPLRVDTYPDQRPPLVVVSEDR